MEKFRAFLEVLKKYHFWVLCGLIVLLSFVSWFLATGDEETRYAAQKRVIDGKLALVKAITNNPEHPSAKYIRQIRDIEGSDLAEKLNDPSLNQEARDAYKRLYDASLTKQVAKASTRLYDEQRDANPLPRLFAKDEEQEEFKAAFEKIWAPMEDIAKLPPGELDEVYRSRYRNHIAEHFPQLFELIERRTVVESADVPAPSGAVRRGAPPLGLGGKDPAEHAKKIGIVDWDDAKQKIDRFHERFARALPSTLDIMLAQEELWVYETLLKVIRYTNNVGPDRAHYQKPANHKVARIKQILAMDIGKDAVQSWTKCENSLFNVPGEAGAAAAPMRPGMPMPAGGGLPASSQNPGESPLAGRYVDDKGKPLSDPTQQPFGEFRMMPINLKVVIEQREIPRLLAECANSAMRIDVRGVRILVQQPPAVDLNSAETSAGGAAGGQAGPAAFTPPMHGGMKFGGMVGHGAIGGDSGSGKTEFVYEEESADPVYQPVPVEVQGIIYIYNPPKVQNPNETAGGNAGPAAPVSAATAGIPARGAAPFVPTAGGVRTSPAAVTPARGGRP